MSNEVGSEDARDTVVLTNAASIGARAGRGLKWSMLGLLVTKMASFFISLVMARLLTPEDFGVFGIALAVTAFLMHVNDAGVIAAVVQWPGRIEDMAATAAAMALAFSVTVYGIIFAIAPWFADVAHSPDATWVIRVLAGVIVIDGITAVRSAALMRRFQQDKLTMANAIGFVVQAPLSIVLALNGAGAFSFAIAQLTGAVITGFFVFSFAHVSPEIGFDRAVARKLLRFGLPLAASLGIEAILLNADYIIVGRLLGVMALGYYTLAYNVSNWIPGVVSAGIRYVSIAGFSRLAEENDSSLSRGVQRTVPLLITLVLPFTILIATLSPEVIAVLYGSKWAAAAEPLRFLMILMAARVLVSFGFDILTSTGRTRATLWLNLGWAAVLIPALYVGTNHGGIRGTAISHAVVGILIAVPLAVVLLERSGVSLSGIPRVLVRPGIAAAMCAGVCLAVALSLNTGPWLELFTAGGAGLVAYVVVVAPSTLWADVWTKVAYRNRARPRHALPSGMNNRSHARHALSLAEQKRPSPRHALPSAPIGEASGGH
jgi:O-antigen/teichoic acid export membrane protein